MQPHIILQQLGISPELVGYWYILAAVEIACVDMYRLTAVTKQLYPLVAQKFRTTPEAVEAAMRRAIKNCWLYGNRPFMEQIVYHTLPQPPVTSHFLGQLVLSCQEPIPTAL